MALSKSKRFEIFKRDGFTCQYCGQRPPDVVLEVDHIDPRSKGGSDDELNLITACFDCNRGKSAKKLTDIHPRPDANFKYLEAQQEIAEAREYLKAQSELESLQVKIMEHLDKVFAENINNYYLPPDNQWKLWLRTSSPDTIEYAVRRTAMKFQNDGFTGPTSKDIKTQMMCYISAILRNINEEEKKSV